MIMTQEEAQPMDFRHGFPDGEVRAEEDCDSDSDTLSNIDARQMFSNRSIKDLSLGNFKHF